MRYSKPIYVVAILSSLFLSVSASSKNETYIERALKRADSNTRLISAIVRDMPADKVEFEMDTSNSVIIPNMVDTLLVNGKIKKGTKNFYSDNIESWFETINFGGGVTNDTCIYLELTRSGNYWSFDSDNFADKNGNSLGGFFPIDDFDNPNNCKPSGDYVDVNNVPHNFHFTMEIHTQFIYHEGESQVFDFTGDDDVWVFVNGKLAIDVGGIHPARSGSVNLDNKKNYLNLTNGGTYSLDMFFCERHTDASNFKVRTTIDIHNDLYLFHDSTFNSIGNNTFDIQEFSKTTDLVDEECGFNIYDSLAGEVVPAHVDFALKGPYFGTSEYPISNGLHFGGITVHGDSSVTIDSLSINTLTPGEYTIVFTDKTNGLQDSVKFTVGTTINKVAVSSAWYKDEDADGMIDAATIILSEDIEELPDSAIFKNPFNSGEQRKINKNKMTLVGGDKITVKFDDEMSYDHLNGTTAFPAGDYGYLYGAEFLDRSFGLNDSIAPLIQKGIYLYGSVDIDSDDNSRFQDTLIIVFSEDVSIENINSSGIRLASLYSNLDKTPYNFELTHISDMGDNRNIYFTVDAINGVEDPVSGDSIKINTAFAFVSDVNGVMQNVPTNRWGFLQVTTRGYLLDVKAITPVNPKKDEIPEELTNGDISIKKGFTIIADYHMIIADKSKMKAELKIFDMVANDVITVVNGKDIQVSIEDFISENSTKVIIVWNGKNAAGRLVASGTYVANLTLTDPNGEKISYRIPLGVKQAKK